MNRFGKAGKLLAYTVGAVTGIGTENGVNTNPLSGINLSKAGDADYLKPVLKILREIAAAGYHYSPADTSVETGLSGPLTDFVRRGVGTFLHYYSRPEQADKVDGVLDLFESGVDLELLAEEISKVWLPELEMDDVSILRRWGLRDLTKNPEPIQPEEVMLQLNALYTVPEGDTGGSFSRLPAEMRKRAEYVSRHPGNKVADYDHPVPLYEEDRKHELVSCLLELDGEIRFEKEQGVLPEKHKVPVLLSVSVTHEGLDAAAGEWIEGLLESRHYEHLQVIVLTETRIRQIKRELISHTSGSGDTSAEISDPSVPADSRDSSGPADPWPVFSVFGKYGRHFNALKYSQLLFEQVLGIRAGFKLDTDEGIRSRDLYTATGKTWFQTLCHPYWGGSAVDWKDVPVLLAVNEGEYINSSDIDKHGYADALRLPDVSVPNSWSGPNMFFQKGFAHGRATALYNNFMTVEEGISHTVVKGGGYGITNDGLRKAAPFTFSWVGRAEDQQFYFSGIPGGVRGIFHPDLRIAHYKSSVKDAEEKTAASRFIGDMYRLIVFKRLAELMDVKDDIDPMPGVFAGELAQAQALFAVLMKTVEFSARGNRAAALYLLDEGVRELLDLEHRIDQGEVEKALRGEKDMWRDFVRAARRIDPEKLRDMCNLPRQGSF